MKTILVSPDERSYLTGAGDRMPLGALYLSTVLTENDIDNEVIDLNHTSRNSLIDKIKSENPDVVGLSVVSSPSFPQMESLAKEIKPYVGRIIAGGYHMSALPNSLDGIADSVVVGNGERGILTALKKDGVIKEKIDPDEYPIPDRSKLNSDLYRMSLLGKRIAPMTTARGCPYACAFCGNMNKTIQFRDNDNIEEEVQGLKEDGFEAVYFYNESHTINRKRAIDVGKIMKRHDMKYRLETRANHIDNEMAEMLSDTGCMLVALGIESGDDKVLEAINKKATVNQSREAVQALGHHGIPTKGYFIMGLPEQDVNSALKTIEFAKELRGYGLAMADFYTLTPFPGSPIHNNPKKFGVRILSKDYSKYIEAGNGQVEPVIETKWLSSMGIKSLVNRAKIEWKN